MEAMFAIAIIIAVVLVGATIWAVYKLIVNARERRHIDWRPPSQTWRPTIGKQSFGDYRPPVASEEGSTAVVDQIRELHESLYWLQNRVQILEGHIGRISNSLGLEQIPNQKKARGEHSVETSSASSQYDVSTKSPVGVNKVNEMAAESYRKLAVEGLRNLPLEPDFVFLDMESSASASGVGESRRLFRHSDSNQNPFVLFHSDSDRGWLFPNPRVSYTESMRYVFPELSYSNYTEHKQHIKPIPVRLISEDLWEIVLD